MPVAGGTPHSGPMRSKPASTDALIASIMSACDPCSSVFTGLIAPRRRHLPPTFDMYPFLSVEDSGDRQSSPRPARDSATSNVSPQECTVQYDSLLASSITDGRFGTTSLWNISGGMIPASASSMIMTLSQTSVRRDAYAFW